MRAFIKGCAKKARTRRRSSRRTPSPVPISGPPTLYQQLSSDAGHPSITALNRHVVGTTEEIVGLSLKPRIKDGEVIDTAFLAAMALLTCCMVANETFGRTTGGERLEELVAEYHELVAQTHPTS